MQTLCSVFTNSKQIA